MGIIIQSQLPTDYSPTYMFLTITQQLNPNLTVNFKTLNKTKNNSFDFNMYNKYDLQTESFDNIDSIKISNKIKPFSEYHTHT
ncbi:MAG: hypothetical protein K2L48_03595 [Mycoplasmoidaceae bacterium]|nr:hypothetical protein [Mycoplasmoidaceae bacterium]